MPFSSSTLVGRLSPIIGCTLSLALYTSSYNASGGGAGVQEVSSPLLLGKMGSHAFQVGLRMEKEKKEIGEKKLEGLEEEKDQKVEEIEEEKLEEIEEKKVEEIEEKKVEEIEEQKVEDIPILQSIRAKQVTIYKTYSSKNGQINKEEYEKDMTFTSAQAEDMRAQYLEIAGNQWDDLTKEKLEELKEWVWKAYDLQPKQGDAPKIRIKVFQKPTFPSAKVFQKIRINGEDHVFQQNIISVGRSEACDIVVGAIPENINISRVQFFLVWVPGPKKSPGGWQVWDFWSAKGTGTSLRSNKEKPTVNSGGAYWRALLEFSKDEVFELDLAGARGYSKVWDSIKIRFNADKNEDLCFMCLGNANGAKNGQLAPCCKKCLSKPFIPTEKQIKFYESSDDSDYDPDAPENRQYHTNQKSISQQQQSMRKPKSHSVQQNGQQQNEQQEKGE